MLNLFKAAMRIVNNYKSSLPNQDWHAFNYNATNLWNMRFFVTSSGSIGIGPTATQPGDQICILNGGSAPYVVRDIPGTRDGDGGSG